MSKFVEKLHLRKVYHSVITGGMTVYEYLTSRLWPLYSAAIVLSVFQMIAVSAEKQILADHYYGTGNTVELSDSSKKAKLLEDSKKYFNEEVTLAIKENVWSMP